MFTGEPSVNEKNKCLNILKVNAFFNKPISIQQFSVQLRRIFTNVDKEEELKDQISSRKELVLLIEDDALISNLVKHFLSDYEVLQAYTVKEVTFSSNIIYRG